MNFNYRGIEGFDVSLYQDDDRTPQKIDFNKMKAWGADFVIVRAGQNLWLDEDFADNWKAAREAGLPRAAYWFYDPRIEPKAQAALFAGLFVNDKPEGRLWVDLEFPAAWGGAYTDWRHWRVFIDELRRLTGLRIGIYTANWWWYPNATLKGADAGYFAQFPLWVAQYTPNPADVQLPVGWTKAMIWQDGTPAIGHEVGVESVEVDHNKWNSDFSFEEEFGGDVQPPSGETMQYRVIWSAGVARRTRPSTFNSYTGLKYDFGATVEVEQDNIPDADDPTNPNKIWVKFTDGLFGASDYPNSAGVPSKRMEKVIEEAKKIVKGVLYFDDNSTVELFPRA